MLRLLVVPKIIFLLFLVIFKKKKKIRKQNWHMYGKHVLDFHIKKNLLKNINYSIGIPYL